LRYFQTDFISKQEIDKLLERELLRDIRQCKQGKNLVNLNQFQFFSRLEPVIRSASGDLIADSKIGVQTHPPGSRELVFHPLLKVDSNRELAWRGFPLPRFLFSEEHVFLIEPVDDSTSIFIQKEIFPAFSYLFFREFWRSERFRDLF
jgi:hypothetical protein